MAVEAEKFEDDVSWTPAGQLVVTSKDKKKPRLTVSAASIHGVADSGLNPNTVMLWFGSRDQGFPIYADIIDVQNAWDCAMENWLDTRREPL